MSFQAGAFQPAFQQVTVEVLELVGGGGNRRRKKRKRFLDDQPLVPIRADIRQAPKDALAVALRGLEVPSQSDVAISTTAEMSMLIRRAQRHKEEDEALMLILSEIE